MNDMYYVYVYLDPTKKGNYTYDGYKFDYEPFYVGKGKNKKYKSHLNGQLHNKEVRERILEIKNSSGMEPIIVKLQHHLNKENSIIEERTLIKTIGTIDGYKNKGCLLNKSFSNIYDMEYFTNTEKITYILEHPYVTSSKNVFVGKNKLISFCKKKKMSYEDLLEGKQVDGWSVTII